MNSTETVKQQKLDVTKNTERNRKRSEFPPPRTVNLIVLSSAVHVSTLADSR